MRTLDTPILSPLPRRAQEDMDQAQAEQRNPFYVWLVNQTLPNQTARQSLYDACLHFRNKTDGILGDRRLWRKVEHPAPGGGTLSYGEPNPDAMLLEFFRLCIWLLKEVGEIWIEHLTNRVGLRGQSAIEAFEKKSDEFVAQIHDHNWKWGLQLLKLPEEPDLYVVIVQKSVGEKLSELRALWPEGEPNDISTRLDKAAVKKGVSHEEQAHLIGLSRATYFKAKAGHGGRGTKIKIENYLKSVLSDSSVPKTD